MKSESDRDHRQDSSKPTVRLEGREVDESAAGLEQRHQDTDESIYRYMYIHIYIHTHHAWLDDCGRPAAVSVAPTSVAQVLEHSPAAVAVHPGSWAVFSDPRS